MNYDGDDKLCSAHPFMNENGGRVATLIKKLNCAHYLVDLENTAEV